MWEDDYKPEGFEWADCHSENKLIYAIIRSSKKSKLLAIFNLNNKMQDYSVKLPNIKKANTILCSDWNIYGGWMPNNKELCSLNSETLYATLPPYSATLVKIL